jgi:hypothetical protein
VIGSIGAPVEICHVRPWWKPGRRKALPGLFIVRAIHADGVLGGARYLAVELEQIELFTRRRFGP